MLTEQVNEGYVTASAASMVSKNSKLKSKSPYESPSKIMASSFSRKSLIKDKSKKSNSMLKLSRRSSGSGVGSSPVISSEGDNLGT